MDPTYPLQPQPVSTASGVCLKLCNHGHCLCNARPALQHSPLPHNAEDMASHRCSLLTDYRWSAILDASCRPLAHRFQEVLGVPQSLKSFRENGLQATCSIGEIIEQNLQADKQKISRSAHIIIRINKHYSHIIHDVPHPYG